LKTLFTILAAILMLAVPINAYAQGVSYQDLLNVNYSGPVFLDAFWTDRTTPPPEGTSLEKVEVGPGDGASVLAVTLVNRGLSDITSVTGYLSLPSGFKASGTDAEQAIATNNEIIPAGDTFVLFFQVDVNERTSVKEYLASLKVDYSRIVEVGQYRNAEMNVPFKLTGKVILDASTDDRLIPGESNTITMTITNRGSAPATGVVVTVAGSTGVNGDTTNASAVSTGAKTFELGVILPGQSASIQPVIYVSNSASETLQTISLDITYGNAYGVKKTSTIPVGMVVLPKPPESVLSVAPVGNSSTILAGKIVDLNFVLSNIGGKPLSDVIISLEPESESVQILGESKWVVKEMATDFRQQYTTQVFAAKDMIAKPTSFNVVVDYLSSGEAKTETLNLGAYVDGEITVRAYEIEVTYIGGRPNITGNLLNEGNILALFTTIELVSAPDLVSVLPPQQYLGDLSENSPLPFSIPISLKDGVREGTYPVSLKVEYKDNLRQLHAFEINTQVNFMPENSQANIGAQANAFPMTGIVLMIGIAAAAVAAAVIIIRRRRRSALKRTIAGSKLENGDDIESVLDSQLEKSKDRK
jgi:hypothetical protein